MNLRHATVSDKKQSHNSVGKKIILQMSTPLGTEINPSGSKYILPEAFWYQ